MQRKPHPFRQDAKETPEQELPELDAAAEKFASDVLQGFARRPRSLPCRHFYDAEGSELFEQITQLPEYYPTRVETWLLDTYAEEIAEGMGEASVLVEFGSGSSRKTSVLLRALKGVELYVPIDVDGDSLTAAARRLETKHEGLSVAPMVADLTKVASLPKAADEGRKLGFFSGSTIGNLNAGEAKAFLANAARLLGPRSAFLVAVDLKKDPAILLPAYNDASGVTAAFNLNLLARINRELGGNIDLDLFEHEAVYDETHGRMEMYLVSRADQVVRLRGRTFGFAKGERIHTENSHKYSVPEFQRLAQSAGWTPAEVWVDADRLFSLHLLRRP